MKTSTSKPAEPTRDDIPTLDELGYDDATLSAEMACGTEGPRGFNLEDFTRGISSLPAHADTLASSYAANEQPVMISQYLQLGHEDVLVTNG